MNKKKWGFQKKGMKKGIFSWMLFWFAAAAVLFAIQACGDGGFSSLFLSAADERDLGEDYNKGILAGDPSYIEAGDAVWTPKTHADSALWNYYQGMARKIVAQIDKSDWNSLLSGTLTQSDFFEFKIIKSSTVNAFAVPGGFVYFYTAILDQFKDEAELAAVLAHETGHVVLHHSRDQMIQQNVLGMVVDALVGGQSELTQAVSNLALNGVFLKGSRDHESEADSMAFVYNKGMGIRPTGIAGFFGNEIGRAHV
jgi:hypothetical protein